MMFRRNHLTSITIILTFASLTLGGCSRIYERNLSTVESDKETTTNNNFCSKLATTSCSDLVIKVINSSPHYSFISNQSTSRGSVDTRLMKLFTPHSSGSTRLGQGLKGAGGNITLKNHTDDIEMSVYFTQKYCFFSARDVSSLPLSNNANVSLSCKNHEGSYNERSGCIVCKVDSPNYKAATLQKKFVGEDKKCTWRNGDTGTSKQLCPPYVTYFQSHGQREPYRIHVGADGLLYNASNEKFDTDYGPEIEGWPSAIFVMGFDGTIYASNTYSPGLFGHSTFYGGEPVAAAGEIMVLNGRIKHINNCSGHYAPSVEVTQQAVDSLKAQGYKNPITYDSCI